MRVQYHWSSFTDPEAVAPTQHVPDRASAQPGIWPSVALTLSLWTWVILLCFPLMTVSWFELTTDEFYQIPENQVLPYQIAGLVQFVAVATIAFSLHIAREFARFTHFQAGIVIVIVLSLALQFHGPDRKIVEGVAYTLILLTAIACLTVVWAMPMKILVTCCGGVTVIAVVFGICAIAYLGWPEERNIGGIHPNAFGTIMLAGFIFSQFCKGFLMTLLRITCLLLAVVVSSRFAVIGCIVSFLVFETTFRPFSVRLLVLALAGLMGLSIYPEALTTVLALDDPERNLGSGFTGRGDLWTMAMAAITDAPFGVGFKRPLVEEAGHNGYLRLLIEFGLVGGGLIIFATIFTAVMSVVEATIFSDEPEHLRRAASARAGGLVALTFASFFQPQMLNLGDIHGVSVILMLFSPSFSRRPT